MKRAIFLSSAVFLCTCGLSVIAVEGAVVPAAVQDMLARHPGLRVQLEQGEVRSIYGRAMTTGRTAIESAERFRLRESHVYGIEPNDLRPHSLLADRRHTQPLMYDRATDTYKFTQVFFSQYYGDIPVFRSELRVLVRNEEGFPSVMAKSMLHPLGAFTAPQGPDAVKPDVALDAALEAYPTLNEFTQPETVIWAGYESAVAAPRLAVTFIGSNFDVPESWLFVAAADTGEILYTESQIVDVDVAGNVSGLSTEGTAADFCEAEVSTPMPYVQVSIDGGATVFADGNGDFVIPNGGTTDVVVRSPIRGEWFRVFNAAGADSELAKTVTPPGPANFLHNAGNAELTRAEVNGYVEPNVIRDFTLNVNASYPAIATETSMIVNVNQVGGICPGNAQYISSNQSINFCRAGSGFPNMAFSSVVWHEYGHRLINAAGSGQGEYGEGQSDVMGVVISDESETGIGFFGNCNQALRDANNICQYSPTTCTTNCGSAVHDCGRLISGSVWSTRNELRLTNPLTYRVILSDLAVNAMLMHVGSSITPDITIDYLILDDDDANIGNGTPHYPEICAGFGAHAMDCPPLALIDFEYPNGQPDLVTPGQTSVVQVDVIGISGVPVPGTGTVSHRVGAGLFMTESMTETTPNKYEATLPSAPCGETIEYYFGAEASGFGIVTDPADAPASFFSTIAAVGTIDVASFDFETAPGWTVSGSVTDGPWDRGVPITNCNRGNPQSDFDGSGQCWLTDNSSANACNSDVDGGTTTLNSPVFDLTGLTNPRVTYARWYNNVEGDSPAADTFVVEVSENGGAGWVTLETVGPSGAEVSGGWFVKTFQIGDFVNLTSQVRFRFNASDLGAGSVVEAAVDAFSIFDLECIPVDAPPTVTIPPTSQTVCDGEPATFSVTVAGTPPFSYQWRQDGVDIAGATSDSYTIASAGASDVGGYSCEITNAFGSVISAEGFLALVLAGACDDTDACTADSCALGTCINTDTTPVGQCCNPADGSLAAIDDSDACTDDICNADGSVDHPENYNVATECCASDTGGVTVIDDANACTDDVCNLDGSVSHTDNYDPLFDCCNPADGALMQIDDGSDCSTDSCDPATGIVTNVALTPATADESSRSVAATPAACSDAVALRLTSPDFPCLTKYAGADGLLGDVAVFQTPAQWSTAHLHGEDVVPEASYLIQAELASGAISATATVTTWLWADIDNDQDVNFGDILLVVKAFQNDFTTVTLEAADLEPCDTDRAVTFEDILLSVSAFQTSTYADTGCPIPCP